MDRKEIEMRDDKIGYWMALGLFMVLTFLDCQGNQKHYRKMELERFKAQQCVCDGGEP
jgi:hypothetical protein